MGWWSGLNGWAGRGGLPLWCGPHFTDNTAKTLSRLFCQQIIASRTGRDNFFHFSEWDVRLFSEGNALGSHYFKGCGKGERIKVQDLCKLPLSPFESAVNSSFQSNCYLCCLAITAIRFIFLCNRDSKTNLWTKCFHVHLNMGLALMLIHFKSCLISSMSIQWAVCVSAFQSTPFWITAPSPHTNPSNPLVASRTASRSLTSSVHSIWSKPRLPPLKEPPRFQWSPSPVTGSLCALSSTHRCSHLLLSYLLFSTHFVLFTVPSCFFFSPHLFTSSLSALRSERHSCFCLYSEHLCRLELVGPRQTWFCWKRGGRRDNTQELHEQHFFKICGHIGTELFLQPFSSCLRLIFATPGMLNVDWWMFPNCASLTPSATTTSKCIFTCFIFLNSKVSYPWTAVCMMHLSANGTVGLVVRVKCYSGSAWAEPRSYCCPTAVWLCIRIQVLTPATEETGPD